MVWFIVGAVLALVMLFLANMPMAGWLRRMAGVLFAVGVVISVVQFYAVWSPTTRMAEVVMTAVMWGIFAFAGGLTMAGIPQTRRPRQRVRLAH